MPPDALNVNIILYSEHLNYLFSLSGKSVRQEVFRNLKPKYKSLDEAEEDFGIDVAQYLEGDTSSKDGEKEKTQVPPTIKNAMAHMSSKEIENIINFSLSLLEVFQLKNLATVILKLLKKHKVDLQGLLMDAFSTLPDTTFKESLNSLFVLLAKESGIDSKTENFVSISIEAMKRLQNYKKKLSCVQVQ